MRKVLLEKTYYGFEDAVDLERDVTECLDPQMNPEAKDIPGEFQGKLKVVVTYEDDES